MNYIQKFKRKEKKKRKKKKWMPPAEGNFMSVDVDKDVAAD